jgi:hypothetical protein
MIFKNTNQIKQSYLAMRKSSSYSPFQGERLPEVIGQGLFIFHKRLGANIGWILRLDKIFAIKVIP